MQVLSGLSEGGQVERVGARLLWGHDGLRGLLMGNESVSEGCLGWTWWFEIKLTRYYNSN